MNLIRFGRFAATACVIGLVAVGCGDDGDEPPPTVTPAGPGTIPEVAAEAGSFSTLLSAVESAGLAETLSGPGPFTVFAPTDAAFAEIDVPEDMETLAAILTYHAIADEVTSDEVVGLSSATTVQGESISIAVEGDSVILNGNVNVTMVDIEASNGVIHVIDAVLIPPSLQGGGGGGGGAGGAGGGT